MRALARVMRCSMALSPTRKARAICLTVRPDTMRSASGDLLRRRQVRMAADEQQPQDVVAVVGPVQPVGQGVLGVLQVGDGSPRAAGASACAPAGPRRCRCCARPGSARRRDRAAARSAASSSRPAGRRPGTPPRPCRGRGNSAAGRRRPGDGPRSGPHRSRRGRSRDRTAALEVPDWPNLIGAAGIGLGHVPGDLQRLVQVRRSR